MAHETRQGLAPDAPSLWICDRERLCERRGRPSEFGNRYYLDDSLLPGPGVLARNDIDRMVYVVPEASGDPLADLQSYLSEFLQAGITVLRLPLASERAAAASAGREGCAGSTRLPPPTSRQTRLLLVPLD